MRNSTLVALFVSLLFTNLMTAERVYSEEVQAAKEEVKAVEGPQDDLNSTLDVYKSADTMILEVRKTVKNTMLDKETLSKGMIRFVKGNFYWETLDPEKNLVIYNGKTLWTVQYPPAEFKDSPIQVAKTKIKNKKNSPIILSEIFGTRPIKSLFNVKLNKKDGSLLSFNLEEKKPQFGLKNLTILIDTKNQRVASIDYIDEVENETKIEFRSTQFNMNIRKSLFQYKPPAKAQVTEY